jgi:long-chain acyl-CoA synthetase
MHMALAFQYTSEDRYLHAAPMFHLADGASTYAVTWVGGCHAFLPVFDAEATVELIARESVSAVLLVPAMICAIVNSPAAATADFRSLRFVLHGAAPINSALLCQAIEVMRCSFHQGYGMTEAAPLVTALDDEERLAEDARLKAAGREAVGVEVQVRRDDGTRADRGEVGEVVLRGPNVMKGYWGKPDATAEVLVDGWYWSRDLGYLDDEGYLFLVDRSKDMIISGGENVYSIEVEDAVGKHPAVLDVAMVGVPDEQWGERVHAVVVLRQGAELELDGLRSHCKGLVADFKCPRSLEILTDLPRSGAGKVLKSQLREQYWAGMDRRIS